MPSTLRVIPQLSLLVYRASTRVCTHEPRIVPGTHSRASGADFPVLGPCFWWKVVASQGVGAQGRVWTAF